MQNVPDKDPSWIKGIDIFSVARYQNRTEVLTNSAAYLAYIGLYSAFSGSIGRLVIAGLSLYHCYCAITKNSSTELKLAAWNLILLVGVNDLVNLFIFCIGLYRLCISIDLLFPDMGLQKKFNQLMDSTKKSISDSTGWDLKASSTRDESKEKTSFIQMPLNFLKQDLVDKKDCTVRFFKAAYALGQSSFKQLGFSK